MQLGIPTSVEKYAILEEIGRGGMATVYRARDQRLQRLVALKVMHPHLQGSAEARARFAREALTVARLRHPGLLEIFDYSGEGSEVSFIATELLEGPTLKDFCAAHSDIPAEVAACMALQVAQALAAAHQAGVVHRDVKPENTMFHHGRLKLTDFGIAQLLDVQGMTTTGQVLGSPGHMAPEQIEGRDCTERTDLFALGTVLYLAAVGELPFSGRNPHHILKMIVEGDFRDPAQVRPAVGARLGAIINRCLQVVPEQRFESAQALCTALTDFLAEMGIDDPAAFLADYVSDPDGFRARFENELIEGQTRLGESAAQAGDFPRALDHWNRVLALQPGHPRVIAAVRGLSVRARHRRWLKHGAIALASIGVIIGLGMAFLRVPRPANIPLPKLSIGAGLGAVASSDRTLPGRDPADEKVERPVASGPAAGQAGAGGVRDGRAATAHERVEAAARRSPRKREPRPKKAASLGGGRRLVRFSPHPANVSIGVDGGPLRPFGPSFRQLELPVGTHSFRFVGAHDCCVDEAFSAVVPAGDGPFVLARQLAFRPAGLYVVSNVAADVHVDGRPAGRTRSVVHVAQPKALLASHRLRVDAPGRRPVDREVRLRAGDVTTVTVELLPELP